MHAPAKPSILSIRTHIDPRGSLGVLEGDDLPFPIARVYYLFDVPIGAVRGEHGHKQLEQVMICMSGRVEITLNDGTGQYHFTLDTPASALHVPPGYWRRLKFLDPGTSVCVLASRRYEPEDYLYSFEDYLAWVRGGDAPPAPAVT
ncbi:sugar 3,4-ketoisomerase [Phaeovulum vinaykumarii]|uniref:WxcM-like, C-terminal n=1 Tax=Phaeovulum vinaykumarii TaxID=407234 RepID=A0A1N7KCU4_9RHOB|nr:FdtA/QdtA family cupin domain-containing protein [Phaeovulum vinaykumarii]SIS59415.1 WxcM-like, C-terminal [Phaeovulum vinaykumarii]SOB94113.1 WxcM-like protein [Phaeovulum vinaykumarii]